MAEPTFSKIEEKKETKPVLLRYRALAKGYCDNRLYEEGEEFMYDGVELSWMVRVGKNAEESEKFLEAKDAAKAKKAEEERKAYAVSNTTAK
jgi:hypothetical protein